jgi:hypothetical protein
MPTSVRRLTPTGRVVRLAVTAALAALTLYGTLWGQDDLFPFGPFRMYATATPRNGEVGTVQVRVLVEGTERVAPWNELGVRPAEVEGQLPELLRQPRLLGGLLQRWEAAHPAAHPTELRLVRRVQAIHDARPVGPVVDQVLTVYRP